MKIEYVKVTFEENKFAARDDLNASDQVRSALGLPARKAEAGASKIL
jgi:hypothetical protein